MRSYRSPRCRACCTAVLQTPERKAYERQWRIKRQADPSWRKRRAEQHQAWYRKTAYGVDRATFNKMLQDQGFVCLLCQKPFGTAKGEAPAVDHCHTTGRVRGLLHGRCNSAIGFLEDDLQLLEAARFYLKWFGGHFK